MLTPRADWQSILKLFHLALPGSAIRDLTLIFGRLGHQIDSRDIDEDVSLSNWRNIDQEMCDGFYERHAIELAHYDAFIADIPALSMLYGKFNKPIIVLCSDRYEIPFGTNLSKWTWLNKYLTNGMAEKRIFLIATNKYDAHYFKWFTYEDCLEVIPNFCEYTSTRYQGVYDNCLYISKFKCGLDSNLVVDKDVVCGSTTVSWQYLAKFKAIVHVPSNASALEFFEQYTAGIPLIFPSWTFLKKLRSVYSSVGVMSELSANQDRGHPSKSVMYCGPPEEDPNNYLDNEVMMDWAKLSDFYDRVLMPEILYFDGLEDLYKIIEAVDFREHSFIQRENVIERKDLIYSKWRKVLDRVAGFVS